VPCIPHPLHHPWFHHNNWGVWSMKLVSTILSSLPQLPLAYGQIFSHDTVTENPQSVTASTWLTKFHTHIWQQVNLRFIFIFTDSRQKNKEVNCSMHAPDLDYSKFPHEHKFDLLHWPHTSEMCQTSSNLFAISTKGDSKLSLNFGKRIAQSVQCLG